MRKTPKNRNTEFPPSAAAAERLADYKGEGNPLGKVKIISFRFYACLFSVILKTQVWQILLRQNRTFIPFFLAKCPK